MPIPFTKIYLCDFGIAKRLKSLSQRSNTLVGTLEYSAPEIFEVSNANYDYKCDMWSVGVVCYILCSGISPFFSNKSQVLSKKKMKFNTSKQLALPQLKDVGLGAKDFISKLLKANPSDRMDVATCFKHPWIKDNEYLLEKVYRQRILNHNRK